MVQVTKLGVGGYPVATSSVEVAPSYWTDGDTFYTPVVGNPVITPPPVRQHGWIDGDRFFTHTVNHRSTAGDGRPLMVSQRRGVASFFRKDHAKK